jgi:hypothetical protein
VAARVQGLDCGEGHLADFAGAAGGPVDGLVVHDDDVAIGCGAQVDLDDREPGFYRVAERRQGVFGVSGRHPAVRGDDHLRLRAGHDAPYRPARFRPPADDRETVPRLMP